MRSLRLMGEEVIPAVREMGEELELFGPFEVDPVTGKPIEGSLVPESSSERQAETAEPPKIHA
jgi:hypothetical protein